ncbi:MAG: hypothetical protein MR357_08055 [Anaeroplasma sp.]|nr:hypothetical protein [Anaeroplasma sp.]
MSIRRKITLILSGCIVLVLFSFLIAITLISTGATKIFVTDLVVESSSATKEYDGLELVCNDYTIVEGNLASNHKIEIESKTKLTTIGEANNDYSLKIVNDKGKDVTNNYNITQRYGLLKINKRRLVLNLIDVNEGDELSSNNIDSGSLIAGHKAYVSISDDGNIVVNIFDGNNNDVTSNYDITYSIGGNGSIGQEIYISTKSKTKEYDGKPLEVHEAVVSELPSNYSYELTYSSSITNVGSVNNICSIKVFDENNKDITNRFKPIYSFGTLTVNQKDIMVKPEDLTLSYLGVPVKYNGKTNVIDGNLAETDEIVPDYSKTSPLSEYTTITVDYDIKIVNKQTHEDVTNCYRIVKEAGSFTLGKYILDIITDSDSKVYDGKPLSASYYRLRNELPNNWSVEINTNAEIIYAGNVKNTVSFIIKDESGNDISEYFEVNESLLGTLTIEKADLYVSSVSAYKEFDGKPFDTDVINKLDIISGLVNGDKIDDYVFTSKENYTDGTSTAEPVDNEFIINTFTNEFIDNITLEECDKIKASYNIITKFGKLAIYSEAAERMYLYPQATRINDDGADLLGIDENNTITFAMGLNSLKDIPNPQAINLFGFSKYENYVVTAKIKVNNFKKGKYGVYTTTIDPTTIRIFGTDVVDSVEDLNNPVIYNTGLTTSAFSEKEGLQKPIKVETFEGTLYYFEYELDVSLDNTSEEYDGLEHSLDLAGLTQINETDYYKIDENTGLKIVYTLCTYSNEIFTPTTIATYTSSDIIKKNVYYTYKVYDGDTDVTIKGNITNNYPTFEIKPREIEIISKDILIYPNDSTIVGAEFFMKDLAGDGIDVKAQTSFDSSKLLSGHTLSYDVSLERIKYSSLNIESYTIINILITDSEGNDVTNLYNVKSREAIINTK